MSTKQAGRASVRDLSTISRTRQTRIRTPRAVPHAPAAAPGPFPTICPAGLTKPGTRPVTPR